MKKLLHTIGLSTLLVLLNLTPAHAATGDFTIYPSYMHGDNKSWLLLDLEQGETITDYVTVENLTGESQTLELNVVEATEENGSFLLTEEKEAEHLENWTALPQTIVELAPFEKQKIPVEITIPEKAQKTDYKASILASKTETNAQNIDITTRIGIRMYVDVHEPQALGANIFSSPTYTSAVFFILSLMGVIGACIYNIIHYSEQRKYAKS